MEELRRGLAHVKRGTPLAVGVRAAQSAERVRAAAVQRARLLPRDPRPVRRAPVLDYDVHRMRRQALDDVLRALDGIDVLLAPEVPRFPRHVMVREDDRARLHSAVAGLRDHWAITRTLHGLTLVPRYATGAYRVPPGDAETIYLDVMSRDGSSYRSRSLGGLTRIPERDWADLSRRQREVPPGSPAPVPGGPIDLVYTWVDGLDPEWQRRRDRAYARLEHAGPVHLHPTGTDPARFVGADELRYSMRSVHQYANWVRRIHVVTDGQVPPWLDRDHPKISMVDHREILGGSRFNSHAIEAALHRIPGLADSYLYLNDDVFFGRAAHPGDFFAADGLARFFPSDLPIDPGPSSEEDLPIMAAAKNGRDLMARRFGVAVGTRIRHTVHPQLRVINEQIEDENPEAMARVRASLFRSPSDLSVAASLHHWYAFAQGCSVPATPNYLYLNIDQPGAGQAMDALLAMRRHDTFCLNQERTGAGTDRGRTRLARFLPRYFPVPAPWELPGV